MDDYLDEDNLNDQSSSTISTVRPVPFSLLSLGKLTPALLPTQDYENYGDLVGTASNNPTLPVASSSFAAASTSTQGNKDATSSQANTDDTQAVPSFTKVCDFYPS